MTAKHVYSVLALTVIAFFGGWGIYDGLLAGFYETHTTTFEGLDREEPLLWTFVVGNFVAAILLVYVLHHANGTTIGRGLLTGAILGFLITLMMDVMMYGSMNLFNGTVLIVDVLVNTVFFGILGAIGGWILGMGGKAAPETGEPAAG